MGTQFAFFIAAELYNTSGEANPKHITRVGTLLPGEGYKLKVNNALQYGQKNAAGELRFVVYHDKERKLYQDRFAQAAATSATDTKARELAKAFGYPIIGNLPRCTASDYLHSF